MLHQKLFLALIFTVSSLFSFAISYEFEENIDWNHPEQVYVADGQKVARLSFEGAVYQGMSLIPYFVKDYPIHTADAKLELHLSNCKYEAVSDVEAAILADLGFGETAIQTESAIVLSRKEPFVNIQLSPLRWNQSLQKFEKLVSFVVVAEVEDIVDAGRETQTYAAHSVLASGDWFKIRINKSGLFKITYQQLQAMGFDVSVNPKNIAVFGNGGGVLPEKNNEFRHDDLVENPIVVHGENDGKLDGADYILFYGEGPVVWTYHPIYDKFYHQTNYYDDYAYYFITALDGPAKRIQAADQPAGQPDITVSRFTDYAYHELDLQNLGATGRTWYGETHDFNDTHDFVFDFPNIIKSIDGGYINASFASDAPSSNRFNIYINGSLGASVDMPVTPSSGYDYGRARGVNFTFTPSADQITVTTEFVRTSSSAVGYLDFIDVNVERQLRFAGTQMAFRASIANDAGAVVRYILGDANNNISIWDITDPTNAQRVNTQQEGTTLAFKASNDVRREYIAFDGSEYYEPAFVEKVDNQDLHSILNIDYLIISHPDFLSEANRLADFHRSNSNMVVAVTTPQLIYNEYSSGSQDISAIRDFIKRIYDHSDPGKEIKYLLLFGDASYDYKDIIGSDNTNFVPCWESLKSLNIISSVATDDYFGYLDDGEGISNSNTDKVDIGIGRFVVATAREAAAAVDKSIRYARNTKENMGSWRNTICFVADDGDGNLHLGDAELLGNLLESEHPVYNLDKIYLDAYPQISTPSGQQAPDMNKAINDRIAKGTLILNYSGHGGEIGWGHERFLQIPDIQSWTNQDMLPIFITATCEFSRYDDPARTSAGELVFLNEKGGAIALFTTARATFASSNLALNRAIYKDNLFDKIDGEYPCFGDVIRKSKVLQGDNDRKFVLLGDPALQLAYPEHWAETTHINSRIVVEDQPDTLKALSLVKVEGFVSTKDGEMLDHFNGEIFPTVFDKKTEILTLGTDNGSSPTTFYLWKSVIFNGKVSVVNGLFDFEFVVPKDIAYKYGSGRISYYLRDSVTDGHGYFEDFIIGGFDETAKEDTEGPEIRLFMNDATFLNGGVTDQSPSLFAMISDSSGINTTGNGIGHDIMAVVDEESTKGYNLNDYYEAFENSYKSGRITYPFHSLDEGPHTLSLKVWDIYNNSSIAFIDFVVVSSEEMVVKDLMNYPNPFMDETSIVFSHNQSGKELEVVIEIYATDGRKVKTLGARITSEGYKSTPVKWDATTDSGGKIGRGLYVYRVKAKNESGQVAEDRAKLLYVR